MNYSGFFILKIVPFIYFRMILIQNCSFAYIWEKSHNLKVLKILIITETEMEFLCRNFKYIQFECIEIQKQQVTGWKYELEKIIFYFENS